MCDGVQSRVDQARIFHPSLSVTSSASAFATRCVVSLPMARRGSRNRYEDIPGRMATLANATRTKQMLSKGGCGAST